MSIIQYDLSTQTSSAMRVPMDKKGNLLAPKSDYQPDDDVRERIQGIVIDFTLGDTVMRTPRAEWNNLSTLERMEADQMSFNTYQPNDGEGTDGEEVSSWKSNAMRPVVRNKCISIAAHATARLIFPKVFAWDKNSDEQRDSAMVMEDLMEWAADQSDYSKTSLYATISALVNPASIVYTEYAEVYRTVKTTKNEDGTYDTKDIIDEDLSGFQDTIVPVNELFIENFYEEDIQKQGFLIWRRVIPYSLAKSKYGHIEDFRYVTPGVQVIYNDANGQFYDVYDPNMRPYDVEEIIYWNRNQDLKLIVVNGVLLTGVNNPNPRNDKRYPFAKSGYELIGDGKCFYYKSLVFKMGPDARIINTLYPMIIDGTYLNIMPPMVVTGSEIIGADVVVPGAVTTLADEAASVTPIVTSTNLKQGFDMLATVEQSLDESSQSPVTQGQYEQKSNTTAYEISRIEQNSSTVLGLFLQMRSAFVKDYGDLRINDILQFMTIGQVEKIDSGNTDLVYRTFLLPEKESNGSMKTRKIEFDSSLPTDDVTEKELDDLSFDTMEKQGENVSLQRVNPSLFRNQKYTLRINPDILNPMSEDLERAFALEEYDRAIANPLLDPNAVTRDFLLGAYPKSKKNPDKYFSKNPQQPQTAGAGSPLQAIGMAEGSSPSKRAPVPTGGII